MQNDVTRRDFLKISALAGLTLAVAPSIVLGSGSHTTNGVWVKKNANVHKGIKCLNSHGITHNELKNSLVYWFNNNDYYRFPLKITSDKLCFRFESTDFGFKTACVASYTGVYYKRSQNAS